MIKKNKKFRFISAMVRYCTETVNFVKQCYLNSGCHLNVVVVPESDAGSGVIKPASSFVIQNRQTSCSMWCPMYRARC